MRRVDLRTNALQTDQPTDHPTDRQTMGQSLLLTCVCARNYCPKNSTLNVHCKDRETERNTDQRQRKTEGDRTDTEKKSQID